MLRTLRKSLGLLIATTFVATFFCMSTGIGLGKDGRTSCCAPASSHSSTHLMDSSEHVQHWQQTFTAAQPSRNNLFSLFNAIFAVLGFGVFLSKFRNYEPKLKLFPSKLCRKRNAVAKLSDPILQALSNGRLNPKLYNLFSIIR